MLRIRQVKHLAAQLGFAPSRLMEIAETVKSSCHELLLLDPAKPQKPREVLDVRGDLRKVQDRLLRNVLMAKLAPSPHAHGGIRGRHIKTNILTHEKSVFVFTADIEDFYPTISRYRVYRLFKERLDCTPDVARLLTKLCTYRHHLALGLVTSPFLAEQILLPIDRRIHAACEKAGLTFTRYVDDIAISGNFNLEKSGFAATVAQILNDHGFEIHPNKQKHGRFDKGTSITNLTLRHGHPDVCRDYLIELERQLEDVKSLAAGEEFTGPYYTKNQIAGRVRFVCWVNPGRRSLLIPKLNSIRWADASREAAKRGLVMAKKRLMKKSETGVDRVD